MLSNLPWVTWKTRSPTRAPDRALRHRPGQAFIPGSTTGITSWSLPTSTVLPTSSSTSTTVTCAPSVASSARSAITTTSSSPSSLTPQSGVASARPSSTRAARPW
ncbi:putative uncharacterized protein DDB_G0283467 [Canis lupus dingo]|uniref:putative uncharacterized protein DDB_G0283467 n=1 Tax=Canis lupus dingo TaxID=286419 RepID=UPI000DC6A8DC|nr:putative uncharacterized protein DDB_G0283467 [Canis lupus dingo]